MLSELFNPIENLYFNEKTCWLTGEELQDESQTITVFPEWILEKYGYADKTFKLMDTVRSVRYADLKVPCSEEVRRAWEEIDNEVKQAFAKGYEALKAFDNYKLFLWVGRIVYGTVYTELSIEKKQKEASGREFKISDELHRRFSYFHLMLQSLIQPISFAEPLPWSVTVVRLKYSKEVFHFRDDTVNLLFTLGVQDWGLIVTLQDNGLVKVQHQELIEKIGDSTLHPLQFDELCAKFLYSSYILKQRPKYDLEDTGSGLKIITLETTGKEEASSKFGKWDDEMYSQVLADYWKPWGIKKEEIIDFPNPPVSFLEDQVSYAFVDPESIPFPY